jgi:endonuclease III related protein
MPSLHDVDPDLRAALADRYGDPPPVAIRTPDDPFGALLGVWLGRSLDPRKVARALDALGDAGLLTPEALSQADSSEVVSALREAGAKVTPKAVAPLLKLAKWAAERGVDSLEEAPTESLRDELRAINGVGAATADELLLAALDRPVYPVDRSSYRVFARHGWIDPTADYDEARSTFESCEPDDAAGLRRLSWWMDRVASEFCKPARPKCERCPLRPFLPESGPIEPGAD